ncbi:MAG: PqqD family protein [Deltaproteobacteria bacterium]|nr:PqqD family protein [Deltaproteobacteria bacterium]
MKFANSVKVRSEKFGSVVFETLRERVFVSNTTGADVLKLIEDGKTKEEIIADLSAKYDGNESTIKNDIAEYFACLEQNNLLA